MKHIKLFEEFEYNEESSIIENKKLASTISYAGYKPKFLSFKEFSSVDASSFYNNSTEAIARLVWSPYDDSATKYRELYKEVDKLMTNFAPAKKLKDKYGGNQSEL